MNSSTQLLPGVRSIAWLDCADLPADVALSALAGVPVALVCRLTPVEFLDEPTCGCKREKAGAAYSETATLKFQCASRLPEDVRLGFVVTDIAGVTYLIGSAEPPFPVVTVEHNAGKPSGDASGLYYEVKHIGLKTLLPCQC